MAKGGRPKGKAQLTKAVLASTISDYLGLPRGKHGQCPEGTKIVDTIFHVIMDALHRGEDVHIQGLGTFFVGVKRPINYPVTISGKPGGPLHKAKIPIPRGKRVRFRPSYRIRRDPI